MPLRWMPSNDFTSTVTLLDPDTPEPRPSLRAAAGSYWPAACRRGGAMEEKMEGKKGAESSEERRG